MVTMYCDKIGLMWCLYVSLKTSSYTILILLVML